MKIKKNRNHAYHSSNFENTHENCMFMINKMILIKNALWNMISCLINLFFEAINDDDEFWVIYSLLIIDDFHNDLLQFMDYRFIPWWKLISKMMHGFCMQTKHEKIDSPKKKNAWLQQITNDFGWKYLMLNEIMIDE